MDFVPAISLRENERGMQIGAGWDPHWHQPTDRYSTFSDKDFRLGLNAAQHDAGSPRGTRGRYPEALIGPELPSTTGGTAATATGTAVYPQCARERWKSAVSDARNCSFTMSRARM